MKRFNILFVLLIMFTACKGQNNESETTKETVKAPTYASFGDKITADKAISAAETLVSYEELTVVDSLALKFSGKVTSVCKAKGCWMKVALDEGEEVMVRFKDYGFFVPKDIEGREVVLNGLAFASEMSVEDQKHYAKDAGMDQEKIDAIATPKKTYSFIADGVLLKE